MFRLFSVAGKAALLMALAATLFTTAPASAAPRTAPRAEPELRVLHVLMVIDVQSQDEWPRREPDLRNVKSHLETGIPAERLQLTLLKGEEVSPRNVLKAIRALNVGPEDGLLLWYSGHGGYSGPEHFLSMRGGEVLRSQVREELQKKNAGLTVLLTTACSTECDITIPPVELRGHAGPAHELNPLFRNLFFQQRGLVDITAAQRGTSDWSDNAIGSMFCSALCRLLEQPPSAFDRDGDGFVNWAEFYTALHEETNRVFQERKKVWNSPVDQETEYADALALPQPIPQLARSTPRRTTAPAVGYRLGVRAEAAPAGVKVAAVAPGSAAARLGLEAGDVLLAINGAPVRSLADYARLVDAAPGGKARLEVRDGRTGKVIVRDVTLDHAR